MALVVDASVAIARRLRDRSGTPYADAVVERGGVEGMVVPDLVLARVAQHPDRGGGKGRIALGTMGDHMKDIRSLQIETNGDHADESVAALAHKHGLSGYDAAYLETAIRREAKLATLDKKLARAAADEGVLNDDPLAGR